MYSVFARLTKSDCIKGGSKLTDALHRVAWAAILRCPCDDPRRVQRLLRRGIIAKARNCLCGKQSGHAARNRRRVEDYTRAAPVSQPPPSALNIDRTGGYIYSPSPLAR